jgi:hypothetical protein
MKETTMTPKQIQEELANALQIIARGSLSELELAQQIAIDALEKCGIKVPNREIIND